MTTSHRGGGGGQQGREPVLGGEYEGIPKPRDAPPKTTGQGPAQVGTTALVEGRTGDPAQVALREKGVLLSFQLEQSQRGRNGGMGSGREFAASGRESAGGRPTAQVTHKSLGTWVPVVAGLPGSRGSHEGNQGER